MPQGSILGPLLFNIGLIDLFYECDESDIASYADDTTLYSCGIDTQSVIAELQITANKLFHWFEYNHKANSGKSHLLLSTTTLNVSIGDVSLTTSTTETLVVIIIDSELSFEQHLSSICSKASKKLHALGRISGYMSFEKRRILMKAFIESFINYCPLIWMFHLKTMKNKINRIHERTLRLVYSDCSSNFGELLKKDGSLSIHDRNIQTLAIEIYKFFMVFLQV